MALHICASGFDRDWDGTYEQIQFDTYAQLPDHERCNDVLTYPKQLCLIYRSCSSVPDFVVSLPSV